MTIDTVCYTLIYVYERSDTEFLHWTESAKQQQQHQEPKKYGISKTNTYLNASETENLIEKKNRQTNRENKKFTKKNYRAHTYIQARTA